jgi:hypothetical protein
MAAMERDQVLGQKKERKVYEPSAEQLDMGKAGFVYA